MTALLVLCGMTVSFAQTGKVTIKGKIDGIKKGRLYLLARSSEEKTDTLGYCNFKKGKFTLDAPVAEPLVTQLVVDGFAGGFMLIAEPGTSYSACLSEGDNFYIEGGVLNNSYTAHMKASDSMRVVIAGMQERYDSLRTGRKLRSASLVNDSLRNEKENLWLMTDGFLAANDNIISAYTIYSNIVMRDMALKETRRMYGTLGQGAKATQYGRMIKERIERLAKTDRGAKAPDFTLPGTDGNPVTMSEVKGRIKIIDFWASWCGPCQSEMPDFQDKYQELGEEIQFLIVNMTDGQRETQAIAEAFLAQKGYTFPVYFDLDSDAAMTYGVYSLPTTYFIDSQGNLAAQATGAIDGATLQQGIDMIKD